jgi:GT2 family glycosyltransferase
MIGAVGPQQIYPNRQWQRSYGVIPGIGEGLSHLLGITSFHNYLRKALWPSLKVDFKPKEVGYIDGAVMAIRRDAFDSVGGFDEDFFFYGEEADFCFRLKKAGWKIMFIPSALVMHVRGGNSTRTDKIDSKYTQMLVDSKVKLVKKHLSLTGARVYCYLQMFHSIKMNYVYSLVVAVMGKSAPRGLSRKKQIFNQLTQTWKEKTRTLNASR